MTAGYIVSLSRTGFRLYEADHPAVPVLESADLHPESLMSALRPYHGATMRLLLADDLAYLLTVNIPKVPESEIKSTILAEIKSQIPEDFTNYLWDYQIISASPQGWQVRVFAPLKEIEPKILDLSRSLQITFEAVEPESVASEADPNPVRGIIKKNDLRAADAASLNLNLPAVQKKSRLFPWFFSLFIFIALNIAAYYVYQNGIPDTLLTSLPSRPAATPTATVTAIPTAVEVASIKAAVTVRIENGSGVTGAAAGLADKFRAAGFNLITTANADRDDYSETLVKIKSRSLLNQYRPTLAGLVSATPVVDTSLTFDVKVIIGKN